MRAPYPDDASRREAPGEAETSAFLTPMIDVVFTLIVFFLLSLRFKSVELRIQSELPHGQGIVSDPTWITEEPRITAKLFRHGLGSEAPFTRIRLGGAYTLDLPSGEWRGTLEADAARQVRYDEARRSLAATIREMRTTMGRPGVAGEIKTPPPYGLGVPHGDVMLVLDAFLEAELRDVGFEGTAPPLPRPGGGGILER